MNANAGLHLANKFRTFTHNKIGAMQRILFKIYLITMGLLLLLASCTNKPTYPENSILGAWMCFEHNTNKQYNVSIDYFGEDSSTIQLYNFYNLGFDNETYATVSDTIITLIGTNTYDAFNGTGHVARDFSTIYWTFSYSGSSFSDPQVEAIFRRY